MAKTLSGQSWVNKFPNSTSINDLVEPFKSNVKKFIAALKVAGATIGHAPAFGPTATLRPKERAYLMHWSYRIAKEGYDPEKVPEMPGVDIDWVHRDDKGKKNAAASVTAASTMVSSFSIVYKPQPPDDSRHTEGKAVDMDISWTASELKIKDGAGKDVSIKSAPRDGGNSELQNVGKSYKVIKLVSDPPHWSTDGH